MKTTFYFILDTNGYITDYNLPFDLNGADHIEDILPLYASINSYEYLIDLVIEAYEFYYADKAYIVDTVLHTESNGFKIIMDDRTAVYKQKSIDQSKQNTLLIEAEYEKLRSQYLSTKNKYMDFVVSAIHQMVLDSNTRIKQSLESLTAVNTYIKDDQFKIDNIINQIETEITHIENSFSHSNIFTHIDPTTLLDKAEHINIHKLVHDMCVETSLDTKNIELLFPTDTVIYGNKEFYKNLLNYYFKKSEMVKNKLIIKADQQDGHLITIKISYYLDVKKFTLPQEFVQTFKFPINKKVETDKEIIKLIFGSLKNAILKSAYYINQIAA